MYFTTNRGIRRAAVKPLSVVLPWFTLTRHTLVLLEPQRQTGRRTTEQVNCYVPVPSKQNRGPPVPVFTGWWSPPDPQCRSPAVTMWGGSSMKAPGCKNMWPLSADEPDTPEQHRLCLHRWHEALRSALTNTWPERLRLTYSFSPAPLLLLLYINNVTYVSGS